MRAHIMAVALGLTLASPIASAQTPNRTPPPSVTLTSEQWACLATRMENLRRSSAEVVRVPLSPCGHGATTRGPGTGNVTAGSRSAASQPPAGVTRAPLYLNQEQLACIERRLPELTQGDRAQIDFSQCN